MNPIFFHLLILVPGLMILGYLMKVYQETGINPTLFEERNLVANVFLGWVLVLGLIAVFNPGDMYTIWGRFTVPAVCLGVVALGFREIKSPDMAVLSLFGKRWRFYEEGWFLTLRIFGESVERVFGGLQRASTLLREEWQEKLKTDKSAKEPNLLEVLSSSWVSSRAALVDGKLVSSETSSGGSPLRGHVDHSWYVVQPIVQLNLGMSFLREKVGGLKNLFDVMMAKMIQTLTYDQVRALQGRGHILLFANIPLMLRVMKLYETYSIEEVSRLNLVNAVGPLPAPVGPPPDASTGWNEFERVYLIIPPELTVVVEAKNRREIIRLVNRHFPGSEQQRYVNQYGVYMIWPLELVEEHPDVIKARSDAQQAKIAIETQRSQAEGKGAIGLEAREIVSASGDPCPHKGKNEKELTPAEVAEIRAWETRKAPQLAEAVTALLKRAVYGATKSTVFTESGQPIRPVVNIDPDRDN